MAGVPNELWKQLTSLIGEDFDEGVEDGDEDSIEPDSAIVDDAETVAVRSSHISVSSDVDQVVSQDSNGCSGDEDDSEDDEEAPAVEVGIEECEMLRDCLQRKLDLLLSTEERYRSISHLMHVEICES